jgi:predicted DNA-binding transcriptional regulator YafY
MTTSLPRISSALFVQADERRLDPRLGQSAVVIIRYTNYRGETAERRIVPICIRFGSTEWHPEEQWLLEAFDLDRDATRAFALKDVLDWRPRPVDGDSPQV